MTLLGQSVREAVLSQVTRRTPMAHETAMMLDPVCGMKVDPKKAAATRTHEGKTFSFCSPGCAQRIDADPHRYAHQEAKGHSH